ncbi:MAG: hypothetical protein GPJ54_05230 [Candidatus Heimdallarchaeota archaeon]|nr:hypothetical protein [Candidatus Heimdallarchaeota archaeon]
MSRRSLAALGIISIIVVSSIAIIIISNDDPVPKNLGPGISDILDENISYAGSLTAIVNFTQEDFYKGESIPFELQVDVESSPARLETITLGVRDLNLSRTANQSIQLDILINPGTHSIPLELKPGFQLNGFVALVNKNYTLTSYQLNYTQIQVQQSIGGNLNHNLYGRLYSAYDQAKEMTWDTSIVNNATLFVNNNNNVTLTSNEENATAIIQAEIETTTYTRLYYNVSGQINSSIQIGINNFMNITNSTSGYLPIGEYQGKQNVTLLFNITDHENVSIVFSIPTRKIAIMTVVANNNWERLSEDGTEFRKADYYVNQLNSHYSEVFNMTFVIVANVNFDSSPASSNLFVMRQEAITTVGTNLKLNQSKWHDGVGTQLENAGGDILLILSNKTMDHLGIVFRAPDGENNLNMAIGARGSLNTGQESIEIRLPSIYGDNLIQHELSHIFRAPDRWTEDDLASIMTKSRPSDALFDIATAKFWLMRTNWLEQDIQTMVDHVDVFLFEF